MNHPIIIDVETQHSFQEVDHNFSKLKVSVVGAYDYGSEKFMAFRENDLNRLFNMMEHASEVIGFNINKFDLPVLAPYYLGNFKDFQTLDLLDLVEKSLGHRVALDDLARATLGIKKSGHGFLAINYFRDGNWEALEKYCLDDVKITKDLYEYAKTNKKVMFNTVKGIKEIKIDISKKEKIPTSVSLSLPF